MRSKKAFKERLLTNPAVSGVSYLNQLPGKITNTWGMFVTDEEKSIPVKVINADPDFIDVMEIQLNDGRNFSYNIQTDINRTFLINEEAAKQLELEVPVGSTVYSGNRTILGVVENFHYNSLHSKIESMAITWSVGTNRACIKFSGFNIEETIQHIDNVFAEFCPGFPFEYDFLDHSFAQQYNSEKRLEKLIKFFVGLAIILSCLGLFALTAFVAERKRKEIGIRKVLGSSNTGIILLLSTSFTKWIIAANFIAWPIAYFVLKEWLQNFAYHIDVNIVVFIISALLALLIALLTVGFQAAKACLANPVESLRYE